MASATWRLAVVGAGWAGLAAAVHAVQRGWSVTLFEASRQAGGRARTLQRPDGSRFDNGQHILIGAYRECLALMRLVGVEPERGLLRQPLQWRYPDGRGLALPNGNASLAFLRGVWAARGWRPAEKLSLLRIAAAWRWRGFQCPEHTTVAELTHRLPEPLRREFIEPLCVAALNTPADAASAAVFLRVLQDALFAGPGSADLLLPRVGLSSLLPQAAITWLGARQATLRLGLPVSELIEVDNGVRVNGESFDRAILACGAAASARLADGAHPDWAERQRALPQRAILTVWLNQPGWRLPYPMTALHSDAQRPAQFAFDLGALGQDGDLFAFVTSAADAALSQGVEVAAGKVLAQARAAFPGAFLGDCLRHAAAQRRAAFSCEPALVRPSQRVSTVLWAAGDQIEGDYPATLEGAVRSGRAAVEGIAAELPSASIA